MGVQIKEIDLNTYPKILSFLISFLLLVNISFVQGFFKTTTEIEIDLVIPPLRFFRDVVYDFPTLAMITMPQAFKKIDVIHGNGGVGTIRIFHLPKGNSSEDIVIERVGAVDEVKLFYSVTMIYGQFPPGVKEIQNDMTFSSTADGAGTILKRKAYFYTTRDIRVDEADIAPFNERAVRLFKAFEAYLVANPDP